MLLPDEKPVLPPLTFPDENPPPPTLPDEAEPSEKPLDMLARDPPEAIRRLE